MTSLAPIHEDYEMHLVTLSVVLSICASYAALDLAGRITAAKGKARIVWLAIGSVAMGVGIWSMHYVGMLALEIGVPISYHLPTVVVSLLAAIFASATALSVTTHEELEGKRQVLGSLFMGCGIAGMHYIGMAAMRCAAAVTYDWKVVVFSFILAVGISDLALRLTFRMRHENCATVRKLMNAVTMGSAIALTHYTGMWAASFGPSAVEPDLRHTVNISTLSALSIGATGFFVVAAAIVTSFLDRFIALQKGNLDLAKERELYFKTMAEALPEIIWTANPQGDDDYFNQKLFDYTGMQFEQLRGTRWTAVVHPDDLDLCTSKWRNALQTGKPYEVQYRLRGKSGDYRWFLGRGNPIRGENGTIIKWFGTCTDIENQKLNEQVLEKQILERTMQLAEANAQLQQEMAEKDFARRQLDEQNEAMMRDLEQRSQRGAMLAKMGELMQSCISRDEVIAVALSFAPRIFPTARGAVFLLNSGRRLAEVVGSWAECELAAADFEVSDCWALRTGQPHLVYADESTAKCRHAAGLKCSTLCVPILAQGETTGILHLQAKQNTTRLDPSELSFRTTFAGQVGLSIANIKLRDALRTQSIRDALTGLYNRRYLEEILEREIRRSARAQQHLGIIMIDLDHFKNFNDAFGHDAGDAVLRETGSFLTKGIRAEDFVCRYGGEEFVLILPTANLESTQARAENLRTKIKEVTILYQGKSMGMITISAGVAVFPDHGKSPKEVIAAADAALYEAKRNGRDQVAAAGSRGEFEPLHGVGSSGSAATA